MVVSSFSLLSSCSANTTKPLLMKLSIEVHSSCTNLSSWLPQRNNIKLVVYYTINKVIKWSPSSWVHPFFNFVQVEWTRPSSSLLSHIWWVCMPDEWTIVYDENSIKFYQHKIIFLLSLMHWKRVFIGFTIMESYMRDFGVRCWSKDWARGTMAM